MATRRIRIIGLAATAAAVVAATVMSVGPQLATAPIAVAAPASSKPTATVSGVADPVRLSLYWQSLVPAYNNMQSALQNIDDALSNGEWDAATTSCQALGEAGEEFGALLPSPDRRATSRVEGVADNIATASSLCMKMGPWTTQDDYSEMVSYVREAYDDLQGAKDILAPS